MPVVLLNMMSTVCFRKRLVSARLRLDESTTGHFPSSSSPTRSMVMLTSPDQSREKRTFTERPSTSRSAVFTGRAAVKYQVELVMSFPTAPSGASGFRASSAVRSETVRVESISGVSRASYPSATAEKLPDLSTRMGVVSCPAAA